MQNGTDKYAAARALNELAESREAADWAGDTAILPKLNPPLGDNDPTDTVPMLPNLLRPQA
jgi:hypothetical protein